MSLESIAPDKEICLKLLENGIVFDHSALVWVVDEHGESKVVTRGDKDYKSAYSEICPAPVESEMLEWALASAENDSVCECELFRNAYSWGLYDSLQNEEGICEGHAFGGGNSSVNGIAEMILDMKK